MNVYLEIKIKSKKGTSIIMEQIEKFGSINNTWKYDKCQSSLYSQNLIESKGLILMLNDNKFNPSFAFCEKKKVKFILQILFLKKWGKYQ